MRFSRIRDDLIRFHFQLDPQLFHLESLLKLCFLTVREIYAIDDKRILFVCSDRISAYDVCVINVSLPRPVSSPSDSFSLGYSRQRRAHERRRFNPHLFTFLLRALIPGPRIEASPPQPFPSTRGNS